MALPPEIALLLLATIIQQLTGDDHPPRTEKLHRLYSWLMAPDGKHAHLAHLTFTCHPSEQCFKVAKSQPGLDVSAAEHHML